MASGPAQVCRAGRRRTAQARRPRPPHPLVSHELAGVRVDFVFAEERVAAEADSRRWHRGRAAFERDRGRDAVLAAAGYRTLRFTDRQIENAPRTVVRALGIALRDGAH